eukprot:88371-Chlamydomonas_euryale.AAC.1
MPLNRMQPHACLGTPCMPQNNPMQREARLQACPLPSIPAPSPPSLPKPAPMPHSHPIHPPWQVEALQHRLRDLEELVSSQLGGDEAQTEQLSDVLQAKDARLEGLLEHVAEGQ